MLLQSLHDHVDWPVYPTRHMPRQGTRIVNTFTGMSQHNAKILEKRKGKCACMLKSALSCCSRYLFTNTLSAKPFFKKLTFDTL